MAKNFVKLQPYELTEEQKDAALVYLSEQMEADISNIPKESIKALYVPGPSVRCLSSLGYNSYPGVIFPRASKDALDIYGSISDEYYPSYSIIVPLEHMKHLETALEIGVFGIAEFTFDFSQSFESSISLGPFVAIVFAGYSPSVQDYSADRERIFDATSYYYAYESPDGLCP